MKRAVRLMKSWVLIALWLVLLASCRTLRFGQDLFTGHNRDLPIEVPDLTWQEQGPIRYTSGRISEPPLLFWAIEINLANPAIQIVVGPEPRYYGVVPAIKVSNFAHQYDCAVALNANPFDTVSDREGEPKQIVGIAIQEGRILADPVSRYGALLISNDRMAQVIPQEKLLRQDGSINYEALRSISYAVGGFFQVLQGGNPIAGRTTRHPRSAVGVSQDGKKLYLLAIDGRIKNSIGTTEHETGQILAALGAWNGLILDGGGSTSLVLRKEDGKLTILNHPVHGSSKNQERPVATCFGVKVIKEP
jgi:exopolysaccharide biosynthesis protein